LSIWCKHKQKAIKAASIINSDDKAAAAVKKLFGIDEDKQERLDVFNMVRN